MKYSHALLQKINKKTITLGIMGIGYVGSAIAEGVADKGLSVIGYDIDRCRVDTINQKRYRHFYATTDFETLRVCDVICICVPTPLDTKKNPDLSYLINAAKRVASILRRGQLIIVESSVVPGTTRSVLLPILAKSSLTVGQEYFLSFSPERIDPGNTSYTVTTIPKVVSGYDADSGNLASAFYRLFIDHVVTVSSLEVAEMTKVWENVFRLVNISLVNEIMEYAQARDINMWEVIAAASTKPFGFLAHYPGPGAGGSCIPVLPKFLFKDAKKNTIPLKLVEHALKINEKRPVRIAKKALSLIPSSRSVRKKRHILLIGIAYKAESYDTRESAALRVWNHIQRDDVTVSYHDPFVSLWNGHRSVGLNKSVLNKQDLIVILTAHKNIQYDRLVASRKPILDTRNVLSGIKNFNIHRI